MFVLLVAQADATEASQPRRNPILNDLRYLTSGIRGFESSNDNLPLASSDTDPPVSWRVAILPMLEFCDVPEDYDVAAPWDSSSNRHVLAQVPECFTYYEGLDFTPYFPRAPRPTDTCYLAVVDDRTMWHPKRPSRAFARDGDRSTVLLIEAPEMRVPWTEPRDLTLDEAVDLLGKPVRRYADHWFWVAEFDGYTRAVAYLDTHGEQLRPVTREFALALLTRNGGEEIPEYPSADVFLPWEMSEPTYVYKWSRIAACSVGVVLVVLACGMFMYVRSRRRAAMFGAS